MKRKRANELHAAENSEVVTLYDKVAAVDKVVHLSDVHISNDMHSKVSGNRKMCLELFTPCFTISRGHPS
jgi:hypothetical protein